MRKRSITVVATVGMSMLLSVFSAPSALADRSVHSPDDGAVAAWKSRPNHLHVKDNKCDSHGVFAKYRLREPDSPWSRVDNHRGCGRILIEPVTVGRSKFIEFIACTNIQLGRDRCSNAVLDRT